MKKLIYLLVFLTFGCSPKYVTQYVLITTEPMPVHGPNSIEDTRFEDMMAGDTIEFFAMDRKGSLVNDGPVRYKTMEVFTSGILKRTRPHSKNKIAVREFEKFHYDYAPHLYKKHFNLYGYVKPEPQSRSNSINDSHTPYHSTPTSGAPIHTGPRGGRYYINGNGNKTYLKRK